MPFDRDQIKAELQQLAAEGCYLGTSSWKYPGWCDRLYDRGQYEYRGKFSTSRFEKNCLAEYAQVFKTVCVDAAYYTFPSVRYLEGLAAQVPADFQFGFKVTDEVTIRKFPNLPRFGPRAGQLNPNFLNPEAFTLNFLGSCESIRSQVGIFIFEFSRFYATDYAHGREFVAALDSFLGALPKGWPYGVELRNRQWLKPEYFSCLTRHEVAHVFNSWTEMPPLAEQMSLPGSRTNPELCAARLLLRPGRKYEEAVKQFQPYDKIQDVNEEARQSAAALILEGKAKEKQKKKKTLIYVNNRLEGNALETIAAAIDQSRGTV